MDTKKFADDIRHACWMVRHYSRNELKRQQAMKMLAALLLAALEAGAEPEPILESVVDGLRPEEHRKAF